MRTRRQPITQDTSEPAAAARGSVAPDAPVALDLNAQLQRTAIMTAAMRVFAREGLSAARVEDILLEADVARRTFYRYFGSKEAVVAALYEMWTGQLLLAIQAARRASPDDPLAGIRAGIELFVGFLHGTPLPRPGELGDWRHGSRKPKRSRDEVGRASAQADTARQKAPAARRVGLARAMRELVELAMRSDSLLAPRRTLVRAEIVKILDESVYALDRRRLDPLVYYGLLGALEGIALEVDGNNPVEVDRARRVLHGLVDQVLGLPGR